MDKETSRDGKYHEGKINRRACRRALVKRMNWINTKLENCSEGARSYHREERTAIRYALALIDEDLKNYSGSFEVSELPTE